ncbi:ArsR family transcriptional regulator [Natrarchaeobius halalkaliphilus]|uniref:ArsR family transcriptional regulator n=1 Tax=Natrarchaeobius halalkaliphilus TaxID=1679091 RepID=A0A3N6LK26_9EURY|nr:ArsR family transcriptional regulator [Natrarchaeobius halalkaliphilus]RQG89113.1 ArsR family transcriptional regulator [Natrarchaeobius halalkaliphilus]
MNWHSKDLAAIVADPTNRAVLDVLVDADRRLTTMEIAERLVSRESGVVDSREYDRRLDERQLSLHHGVLPKLDEIGIIDYDARRNVVSVESDVGSEGVWAEFESIDELLARINAPDEADERTVGMLEGREALYEYGRTLADRSDDELFLIYTSDELLDGDCLPQAKNAIQRGVEFHAGVQGSGARQFFQERLPDATVWEPQLDWCSDPSVYPTISRLIVSDRKRVLVGLWDEPDADDRKASVDDGKTEIGMVGEGRRNPLVVLVRELLGPRLDHLDYQSDAFLGDLPFET